MILLVLTWYNHRCSNRQSRGQSHSESEQFSPSWGWKKTYLPKSKKEEDRDQPVSSFVPKSLDMGQMIKTCLHHSRTLLSNMVLSSCARHPQQMSDR